MSDGAEQGEVLEPGAMGRLAVLTSEMRAMKREIAELKEGASRLNANAEKIATNQEAITTLLEQHGEVLLAVYQIANSLHQMSAEAFGLTAPPEPDDPPVSERSETDKPDEEPHEELAPSAPPVSAVDRE